MAADAARHERAGLEYEVGEVWDVEALPDPHLVPPHVENILVQRARWVERMVNPEPWIRRHMPPVWGGPEKLFEGLLQALPSGGLFVAESTGVPARSTMFWVPDQPLQLDTEGKRIRYRYLTGGERRTLTFVGFQEPLECIPAGTLLRVSLAHWWRPRDKPGDAQRCFLQLSGWFLDGQIAPGGRRAQVPATEQGAASERPGRQARLNTLLRYAETSQCRRIPLLAYFGETLEQPCGHCDNCRQTPPVGETTDVTAAARKFLSCVQRTGERFGTAHIIGVLRGSRSEKILTRGHDRLSTFGIGQEHSAAQWRDLARAFIQLGLLEQDVEYGSLRLTPKARGVLRGEQVRAALAHPTFMAAKQLCTPAKKPVTPGSPQGKPTR